MVEGVASNSLRHSSFGHDVGEAVYLVVVETRTISKVLIEEWAASLLPFDPPVG